MIKFNQIIKENIDKLNSFVLRNRKPPKKVFKAYKVFTIIDGKLYSKFVNTAQPFPIGEWLDGVQAYNFTANNGLRYAPAEGGVSIKIPNEQVKQQLLSLGYIKKPTTTTVTCVSYRPGIHASTLPLSPQMGTQARGEVQGYPYPNYHDQNNVVAQVLLDAENDYNDEFIRTAVKSKDGNIILNRSGLRRIPLNGIYAYTSNTTMQGKQDKVGRWYISGGMKINRILSRDEVNEILDSKGVPRQLWVDQVRGMTNSDKI